jgi:formylglycine-generating enzyme required for sulfatase activity
LKYLLLTIDKVLWLFAMNDSNGAVSESAQGLEERLRLAGHKKRVQRSLFLVVALVPIILGIAYLLLGAGVEVRITPSTAQTNATLSIQDGVGIIFGQRVVAAPGQVALLVEAPGFVTQKVVADIVSGGRTIDVALEKLPDRYTVSIFPHLPDAEFFIDEKLVSQGSTASFEIGEGNYMISAKHPQYRTYERVLDVQGGGNDVALSLSLDSAIQVVNLSSAPSGARIFIDGELSGVTPQSLPLLRGRRELRFDLDGYVPEMRYVNIVPDERTILPTVALSRNPGRLEITSEPIGASVLMNGEFRGNTPVTIAATPNRSHELTLSHPGHQSTDQIVEIASGARKSLSITLPGVFGIVDITSQPSGQVLVNGKLIGETPTELKLKSVKQEITITRDGYVPFDQTVEPDPDIRKTVNAKLITKMGALINDAPKRLQTSDGQSLVLIQPGTLKMGAPRSEAGQRANEVIREVQISRHFYIGEKEVTSGQFAAYRRALGNQTVAVPPNEPATNVSWEDAARYANWLSEAENLRPVYEITGQGVRGFDIDANGYRLPTEAEWAWVARHEGGGATNPLKFPWGQVMPVPEGAGNYADESAMGRVESYIPLYNDARPKLAPVASFSPTSLGLYDLGGNVSEWIHDHYELTPPGTAGIERDRVGPPRGRQHVVRGSSWRSATLTELRYTYREAGSGPRDDVGFRLARWLGGRNGE